MWSSARYVYYPDFPIECFDMTSGVRHIGVLRQRNGGLLVPQTNSLRLEPFLGKILYFSMNELA